jgi:hypothetical protein
VPDQGLVALDQAFEGPGFPGQYGGHDGLVLTHAPTDTLTRRLVAAYSKLFQSAGATGPTLTVSIAANGHSARTIKESEMGFNFGDLIPMVLFISVVLAIKVIMDAKVRRRIAEANPSEDLVKAMLIADEQSRRLSALKWGLVMTVVGLAFGLISALRLSSDNPGSYGLLIGAAGVGMLAYHALANRKV